VIGRLEAEVVERVEAGSGKHRHDKHVSAAAYADTTVEDAVCCTQPLLGSGETNTLQRQLINMQRNTCRLRRSGGCNVDSTDGRNFAVETGSSGMVQSVYITVFRKGWFRH
jgi:hypothetical protein